MTSTITPEAGPEGPIISNNGIFSTTSRAMEPSVSSIQEHDDTDALASALAVQQNIVTSPVEYIRKKLVLGRKAAKKILETGDVGMVLDILNVSLSLLACALYVIGVDVMLDNSGLKVIRGCEKAVTIWFCFDYLSRMMIADNVWEYFMDNKIDLISILPGVVDFLPMTNSNDEDDTWDANQDFEGCDLADSGGGAAAFLPILGIARVLKVLRLLRLQRLISHFGDDEVMKQGFFMVNIFVFVIILGAGLYHFTENQKEAVRKRFFDSYGRDDISKDEWYPILNKLCDGQEFGPSYPKNVRWAKEKGIWFGFGTSAYFVVVTMTTVGFGDITPTTGLSECLASFMIICTVVLVPMQTNELLSRINEQSKYNKHKYTSKNGHCHVVVAGAVNSNGLNYFVNEFFNADQLQEEFEDIVDMVVMAPSAPSQDVVDLMEDPKYLGQIFYVAGSVLSSVDLKRVSFSEAKAIWLLSDKFSLTPSEADGLTVIRALSLKRFLTDSRSEKKSSSSVAKKVALPQVFTQLIKPSNRDKLASRDGEGEDILSAVLCLDEIKSVVMAKSCSTPGMFTLLNNLVTSASSPDPKAKLARWEWEYQQGRDHEIYKIKLASAFDGFKFKKIVEVAYKNYDVVLIAVEHERGKDNTADGEIHVAPHNLTIETSRGAWAYVITEDKASANQLGTTESKAIVGPIVNAKASSPSKLSRAVSLKALGNAVLDAHPSSELENFASSPEQQRRSFSRTIDTSNSTLGGTADTLTSEPPSPMTPSINTTKDSIKMLTNDAQLLSYMYEDKRPLREGIIRSVDELLPEGCSWDKIHRKRRHTIVCAYTADLYHFIAPLRSRNSSEEMVPVVVIVREQYAAAVWDPISIFHDVYLIIGSPSNAEDLIRAGVLYAKNFIVFANTESQANVNLHGDRNTPEATKALGEIAAMSDSDTVFINSAVSIMNPTIQIVSELVHWGNIPFLNDAHSRAILDRCRKDVVVWPLVAAGNVYVASLNDYLSAQLFHNPSLVSLLEKIVIGDSKAGEDGFVCETTVELVSPFDMYEKDSEGSSRIAAEMSWKEVFLHILLHDNAVPIALYRGTTRIGEQNDPRKDFQNNLPYVVTNPPGDKIVRKQDRVFILANNRTVARLKKNSRDNGTQLVGDEDSKPAKLGFGPGGRRLSKLAIESMSLQELAFMTSNVDASVKELTKKIDTLKG